MNASTGPVLSIEEIERAFAGKWVLIVEPQLGAHHELRGGRVAFQAESRDPVDRKASQLKSDIWSVRFLGPWPEDVGYLL